MHKDCTVLACISGRGSNLASLLKHARTYSIIGILSNNKHAPGLALGASEGLPCYTICRSDFPNLSTFKQALLAQVQLVDPDLIALAGFMQVLQPKFVESFVGRIVNIHPSLLPKYPGLDTHQRALEAGEVEHGCTVHFVDSGVDTGPTIAQARCPCRATDNPETLAARVLALEHQLYPWVLNTLAAGDIILRQDQVVISPLARQEAAKLGFWLPPAT